MKEILVYGLSGKATGGIETYILEMNRYLQNKLRFVYVIEGDINIHEDKIKAYGGGCVVFPPKKKMLRNMISWVRLMKCGKYEKVYFNLYSMVWSAPIIITRLMGAQVYVHAHNSGLHDVGRIYKFVHIVNSRLQGLMKLHRITNSDISCRFMFGKCAADKVYCAIDVRKFAFTRSGREYVRKKYGVTGKNVYGFCGRIEYEKNPLLLADIFGEIIKIDEKAAFLICGTGKLEENLRKKAESLGIDIIFAGQQKNMVNYYSAMDCFILPSRFEGLGIVLIEAQANGLCCVTSKGVVPEDTKITDIIKYVSLQRSAKEWAKICVSGIDKRRRRENYQSVVMKSRFNIEEESKILLRYLEEN